MTEDFRVVERRDDDKNGRDVGLLVYVNKETWDRLYKLCKRNDCGPDAVIEDVLKFVENLGESIHEGYLKYSFHDFFTYSSTAPDLIDKNGKGIFIGE